MKLATTPVPQLPPPDFIIKEATGIAFLSWPLGRPELMLHRNPDHSMRFWGGTANPDFIENGLAQSLAWCEGKGLTVANTLPITAYKVLHRSSARLEWAEANAKHGPYSESTLPAGVVANYEMHGIIDEKFVDDADAARVARVWVRDILADGQLVLGSNAGETPMFANTGIATIVRYMLGELMAAQNEGRAVHAYQQAIDGYAFVGGPVPLNPA